MKRTTFFLFVIVFMSYCTPVKEEQDVTKIFVNAPNDVEAGRYIIRTAGCNDCHTDGFMQNPNIPETEWLTGSALGWQGPWGTSYPPNLRLSVENLTQDQWLEMLKTRKGMPPMPWSSVNNLSEQDAKALYAYIKWLGPKGSPAPTLLAPGVEPSTPYLSMLPKNLPMVAKAE